MNGIFLTLEGGEGCGKSTQLERVAEALRAKSGREVVTARSPGGTAVAEKIRAILKTREPGEDLLPETEMMLFGACHAQMCEHMIRPALARGAVVISDRFTDSTLVYQGCARRIAPETVARVNEFVCRGTRPDLVLVLDIPVELGLRRTTSRSAGTTQNDRFDSESTAFHTAVRNGFLELARREPDRFAVIDASPSPEEVTQSILEAIHARLAIL
ncbi:MAG: dTMP kinase [Lentisphaeria bacterium]|nr:dTMP kinase [Lentisphaeria bacterium]